MTHSKKPIFDKISHEERELFRKTISKSQAPTSVHHAGIIKAERNEDLIPPPQDSEVILGKILPDKWASANDKLQFFHSSIPQRTRSQLKRGQIPVEAELDLHRMSGNQALELTRKFLLESLQKHRRCVLIIHGKGDSQRYPGPILKNLMAHWLKQQPFVLAYVSSLSKHGSTGAIYLILKT